MLFGRLNLIAPATSSDDAFVEASRYLLWDGCRSEEVASGGLWARASYSAKVPLEKNDFIYEDQDSETLVLADGFIYNKKEVLEKLGYTHHQISVPRLVALAFKRMGMDFVGLLNGDFAICIYEKRRNRLLLFRDHLGIRPLAWSLIKTTAYFATDHMGLCKVLSDGEKIQRDYLLNMFMFEGMRYDILPHKGVNKVLPGHCVEISGEGATASRYWMPEKTGTDFALGSRQVRDDLEGLVSDAVRIRTDDRFLAGTHLSGGLDSGLVAAMARECYKTQACFPAFSWSPDGRSDIDDLSHDETQLVKKVCEQHGMSPFFTAFAAEDLIRAAKSWRFLNEAEFEQVVARQAARNNINLLFSGWGGDEFLSIGNRGIDPDLVRNGDWRLFLTKNPLSRPRKFMSALLFNVCFPSMRRTYLKQKTFPEIFRYIRSAAGSNLIPRGKRMSFRSRRAIHLFLLFDHHLAERTEDWYVLGQVSGIEYRYPLLDRRIVEYMLKVPSRSLVKGSSNRIVVRDIAAKYLPAGVVANNSKDDPQKSRLYEKARLEVFDDLFAEIPTIEKNPDLAFINFALLVKDVRKCMASADPTKKEAFAGMLLRIKAAHELTRVFYNHTDNQGR